MLFLGIIGGLVLALLIFDVTQKKNAIWHNFPLIGHGRNLLIELGPELRQYIVANNREESPFNRSEREWIYHSAKRENNYFGFGTDDQVYNIGYPVIKHAMFPYGEKGYTGSKHDHHEDVPRAKVIGQAHGRKKPYRPASIINISRDELWVFG